VTLLSHADHVDRDHAERLHSCGRAPDDVSLRVVDPSTGEDLPEGEVGEVSVRSPRNMSGYFALPQESAAALTTDGFVRTSDGGYLLDCYLHLKDRIKDMIVSGGENIYALGGGGCLARTPRHRRLGRHRGAIGALG